MQNIINLLKRIDEIKTLRFYGPRFDYGVALYAEQLLKELYETIENGYFDDRLVKNPNKLGKALLNGAKDWISYSHDGNAKIYNEDIAFILCNDDELKTTKKGKLLLNNEPWLDMQARALSQAAKLIKIEAAKL